jgi:hypothetical protein
VRPNPKKFQECIQVRKPLIIDNRTQDCQSCRNVAEMNHLDDMEDQIAQINSALSYEFRPERDTPKSVEIDAGDPVAIGIESFTGFSRSTLSESSL